jgi:shikimate dehydrogenase
MRGGQPVRIDYDGQVTAGVCGWPIAQSKSPIIHRFWLEKLGIPGDYVRLPVAPETAHEAFRALPRLGITGVNVTAPLKQIALKAADRIDLSAGLVLAANQLSVLKGGEIMAFNTDWLGFMEPLVARGLRPQTAVLVGAGGAARAVVNALNQLGVEELTIVNRSRAAAEEVAELFMRDEPPPRVVELVPGMVLPRADLVVNSSSLGMVGKPPLDVRLDAQGADTIVYDLVYAPLETGLLAEARQRGLALIDGLEMLVGQARTSFEDFFLATPPRAHDAALRALLLEGQA